MYPILIQIGSLKLYTYGLFVALGFLLAMHISKNNAKSYGMPAEPISDLFFIILLSALVGARLLYVLINLDTYKLNPIGIFQVWNGGLVFFGGFVAAVLASLVYMKKKQLDVWQAADVISPGIAAGHAVGRIGCLFAGCCYGKTCDLPFAITFIHPESLAPLDVHLYPTQVFSIISNLVIFGILVMIQKRKRFNGMVFLVYVMIYSLFRAIIEFFRGDFRGDFIFDFISMSQGIGLVVSIIALMILIKRWPSSANTPPQTDR